LCNNVYSRLMLLCDTEAVFLCCAPVVINRSVEFCRRHSELRVPMTSSQSGSTYVASLMTSDAPTCARSPWSVEASPSEMPFGLWTGLGSTNHVLDGSCRLSMTLNETKPSRPGLRPKSRDHDIETETKPLRQIPNQDQYFGLQTG